MFYSGGYNTNAVTKCDFCVCIITLLLIAIFGLITSSIIWEMDSDKLAKDNPFGFWFFGSLIFGSIIMCFLSMLYYFSRFLVWTVKLCLGHSDYSIIE